MCTQFLVHTKLCSGGIKLHPDPSLCAISNFYNCYQIIFMIICQRLILVILVITIILITLGLMHCFFTYLFLSQTYNVGLNFAEVEEAKNFYNEIEQKLAAKRRRQGRESVTLRSFLLHICNVSREQFKCTNLLSLSKKTNLSLNYHLQMSSQRHYFLPSYLIEDHKSSFSWGLNPQLSMQQTDAQPTEPTRLNLFTSYVL